MSVRAKMRVTSLTKTAGGATEFRLYAVADEATPENERYHRYTPSASVQICIDNPPAAEWFEKLMGSEVYVDFTVAKAAS